MDLQTDYRALREAAGVVDRSSRGRITVAGADRRSYLQGLLSNDIAALVDVDTPEALVRVRAELEGA